MKRNILFTYCTVCLLMNIACNNTLLQANKAAVDINDKNLISEACEASIYAMKIAEEGSLRSAAFETKQFADKSLESYKFIIAQLTEIAKTKEIELPLDMNSDQLKQWREMVKLKGSLFDRSFIEQSDKQNTFVLDILAYISKKAKDAEIKTTAKNILSYTINQQSMPLDVQKNIATKN